ncbi:MAG: hypothetical protein U0Q16_13305 [Bryobacteraceae bacterium]
MASRMLATLAAGLFLAAGRAHPQAPAYSPSSIVNAASSEPGPLSPNGIGTLFGQNLAYVTRALQSDDIRDNRLPTQLTGAGVRVLIANIPAFLYFVSPRQVNFLVPSNLRTGNYDLQLVLDGRAGPSVRVEIAPAAPALFVRDERIAIAVRADGSLVTASKPARPGEVVILYANGLGATQPPLQPGQVAKEAAWVEPRDGFRVLLNGQPVAPDRILYAGVAPGFAGLYQVNLMLPAGLPADPEIRISAGGGTSPAGILLPAATGSPEATSNLQLQSRIRTSVP